MGKRRSSGEGSLYKRADGLWCAQISLSEGKHKTKCSKSQEVVKTWLLEQRTAYKNGALVANSKVTVGEFLDRWLEEVAKNKLRDTTYVTHESLIRNHIKPLLGDVLLTKLTPSHLQNLYALKRKEGLSKRTVKYIHTILHQLLTQAVKWGIVAKDVSEAVDVAPVDKHPIEALTQAQVSSLLKVLEDDRLLPLYVLIISTGLRRGEAVGIKWENVDLVEGMIRVKSQIINVKGRIVEGEPKTEAARRIVALPDYAKNVLIDHKLKQTVESEYVFCTRTGRPISPRNILRHLKLSCKKAGLPETTTVHQLRHTFVSWALTVVPPRDVQAIVGHSDFKTTVSIYGHLMPGAQVEAAKKMNQFFPVT